MVRERRSNIASLGEQLTQAERQARADVESAYIELGQNRQRLAAAADPPLGWAGGLRSSGAWRAAAADRPGAAAPPGTGEDLARICRQDLVARSQRQDLQMADRSPWRAGLSFLRRQGEPWLPLLRGALRSRLSGPAAAPRSTRPAVAVRRPPHALIWVNHISPSKIFCRRGCLRPILRGWRRDVAVFS